MDTPPYPLRMLAELLGAQGRLTPHTNALLSSAEANLETTGAVFVLSGRFNRAELTPPPPCSGSCGPSCCGR